MQAGKADAVWQPVFSISGSTRFGKQRTIFWSSKFLFTLRKIYLIFSVCLDFKTIAELNIPMIRDILTIATLLCSVGSAPVGLSQQELSCPALK